MGEPFLRSHTSDFLHFSPPRGRRHLDSVFRLLQSVFQSVKNEPVRSSRWNVVLLAVIRRHCESLKTIGEDMYAATFLKLNHQCTKTTCVRGPPVYKDHLCTRTTCVQGTPVYKGHLSTRTTCLQGPPVFRDVHLPHLCYACLSLHVLHTLLNDRD